MVVRGKVCQRRIWKKCIVEFLVFCSRSNYPNVFKVSNNKPFKMALCQKISAITQKIERSDTSPDHASHACVHKIRDTFQLHNSIYSTLQKVKQLQTTIPLLWSSAKIFVKFGHQWCSLTMKLTTILFLVDNASCLN